MENKDAKIVLKNLYDALFQAEVAIDDRINYQKERLAMEERFKEIQKELKQLENNNHINNILVSAYEKNANIKIEICPECNGDGGFSWQTEYDAGGEQCQACEGAGYFIKENKGEQL